MPKRSHELNKILTEFMFPYQGSTPRKVYRANKERLPALIQTASDLGDVLYYLSRDQRSEVLAAVKDKAPTLVHTTDDVRILGPYLEEIFTNNGLTLEQFKAQFSAQYQLIKRAGLFAAPKVPKEVSNATDLQDALNYITQTIRINPNGRTAQTILHMIKAINPRARAKKQADQQQRHLTNAMQRITRLQAAKQDENVNVTVGLTQTLDELNQHKALFLPNEFKQVMMMLFADNDLLHYDLKQADVSNAVGELIEHYKTLSGTDLRITEFQGGKQASNRITAMFDHKADKGPAGDDDINPVDDDGYKL